MYKLKPSRHYVIDEVYPESNYACFKDKLEGSTCVVTKSRIDPKLPTQLDLPSTVETSRHVYHARVKILNGSYYGRIILLTHFSAHILDNRDQCTCKAYPFPHTKGGGKCKDYSYDAYCGSCGLACIPKWVDEGIGETEAWGIVKIHHDYVWRSHCCDEYIYGDCELETEYEPETL